MVAFPLYARPCPQVQADSPWEGKQIPVGSVHRNGKHMPFVHLTKQVLCGVQLGGVEFGEAVQELVEGLLGRGRGGFSVGMSWAQWIFTCARFERHAFNRGVCGGLVCNSFLGTFLNQGL